MITIQERDRNIIAHISNYCDQIEECLIRSGKDYDLFLSDSIFHNAVSMVEFQIGELAGHLSDTYKDST